MPLPRLPIQCRGQGRARPSPLGKHFRKLFSILPPCMIPLVALCNCCKHLTCGIVSSTVACVSVLFMACQKTVSASRMLASQILRGRFLMTIALQSLALAHANVDNDFVFLDKWYACFLPTPLQWQQGMLIYLRAVAMLDGRA